MFGDTVILQKPYKSKSPYIYVTMKIRNFVNLKETARDIIAFGSIPFLILVLARVWILNDNAYLLQFIIASLLFLICAFFLKADIYTGISLIVAVLLSIHYNDSKFTFFAGIMYLILLASLVYLKKEKLKILYGILLGLISIILSHYLAGAIIP
jgi:hypothetical protein